jgi:predicted ester cyclase
MMTFIERFAAMFDGARLDAAEDIFALDFIGHLPLAPVVDREGWKAYIRSVYAAISHLSQQIDEVVISEDRLVLRVTFSGIHSGVLFGIPATGVPVSIDGIGIFRFNDKGQAAEIWAVVDVIGLLVQVRSARARQRLHQQG